MDALVVGILRVRPRDAPPEKSGPDPQDEFPARPMVTRNDGICPRVLILAEPGVFGRVRGNRYVTMTVWIRPCDRVTAARGTLSSHPRVRLVYSACFSHAIP